MKLPSAGEMRKTLAAVAGVAAEAVALGILHGTALNVAQLIIAGATAAGVFVVPNAPKKAAP